MAPHTSTLAWKIPRTEEPGRLQSMGSLRVRHDWSTSLSLFTFMHWRRTWQPTPVFLPGESRGRGSLVGCRLWGRTELDTAEVTSQQHITLRLSVAVQWCHRWLPSHSHTQVGWLLSASKLLLLNCLLSRSSTILTCRIFISYCTISNLGLLPLPFFEALS